MASRAEYNKKKQTESVQFGAGQNNINPVSGGGEGFSSRGVVSMVGDEQKLVQAGVFFQMFVFPFFRLGTSYRWMPGSS